MFESTLKDKEEMNIHLMRWVIMLIYDANENGQRDKWIRWMVRQVSTKPK